MKANEAKEFITWAKAQGIKRVKVGTIEVEFGAEAREPMDLDPRSLSKVFSDGMPPDSKMLFASTEGIADDETPISQQRENERMA